MTREVPVRARELASRLAALFESDSQIAERLNDAQHRLRHANSQLWSGLHPDALGLLDDDTHRVAIGRGGSVIAGLMIDVLRPGGGEREVETAVLARLQQTHWAIHRAFIDYQTACETLPAAPACASSPRQEPDELSGRRSRARRRRPCPSGAAAHARQTAARAGRRVPSWGVSTIPPWYDDHGTRARSGRARARE
jgi:hypothetical protein